MSTGHRVWLVAHTVVLVAVLATMGWVNTAFPPPGSKVTGFIPLTAGLLVWGLLVWRVTRPGLRAMFSEMTRAAWLGLAAATALFGYAMISTQFRDQVILVGSSRTVTEVPTGYTLMPLVSGLLAVWSSLVTVAAIPRHARLAAMWWVSAALVPITLLGWWRTYLLGGGLRLWTQAGGAAVYPVLLMVALAVAVAALVRHHRPRLSLVLVLCHVVMLLLTGSRGALLMMALFAVLALVRLRHHTGLGARLAGLPVWSQLLVGLVVVLAVVSSPLTGRLGDNPGYRMLTWRVGVDALGTHPDRWLFGLGSGTIWPWFAYESTWQPVPWRSRLVSPFGETLYHAHSLYLGVLAELGLVGLALLTVVVFLLVIRWIRGEGATAAVLASAVCACLVGFAFDTYLFKSFPISWVWWLAAFAVLLEPLLPATTPASTGPDQRVHATAGPADATTEHRR